MRIEESLNVTFDESLLKLKSSPSVEDDRINEPIVQDLNGLLSLQVNVLNEGYPKSVKEARGHSIEQVIVKQMMEENVYALHKEMREIHASINNDLKVLTAVVEDIAMVFLQDNDKECEKDNEPSNCSFGRTHAFL
nr:hypothetical protein [Tanacetum cinerariifolium]